MKANELMIGDFLRFRQDYPFKKLQGKIVKVEGIRGRVDVITVDTGNFYEYEHPDCLEPIPLTPEILEKNGFKWENGPYSRWCHAQVERMIITLYRSDTFYSITIHTDDYLPVLNNIQLHSVHELQHALRLCGIDKEIEL